MLLNRKLSDILNDQQRTKTIRTLVEEGATIDVIAFGASEEVMSFAGATIYQYRCTQSSAVRSRIARWSVVRQHTRKERYTVVHCHDYLMLELAIICRINRYSKVIYDSHEYFIGSAGVVSKPKPIQLLIRLLENTYIKCVNAIIVVSDPIRTQLPNRQSDIPIAVIRNIPDWPERPPEKAYSAPEPEGESEVRLIYHGLLTRERGMELLAQLVALLPNRYSLTLVGMVNDDIRNIFSSVNGRIHFTGNLSVEAYRAEITRHHLGVYPIRDICLSYRYCLPNKLFEAVRCHMPVVASNLPEMAHTIARYGIGEVAEVDNPRSFAQIIINAVNQNKLAEWHINCRRAAKELCWERESVLLIDLYHQVLKSPRS